jgi:transcriptional regulator with XRE-family HTH domain
LSSHTIIETAIGVFLIVTGEQLRGARAMARIEQADLASRAKVSVDTIKRLERTVGPISANVATMAAIVGVLEAAGVEFTNGGQPGVRIRKVFEQGDYVRAIGIDPHPSISVGRDHAGDVKTTTTVRVRKAK